METIRNGKKTSKILISTYILFVALLISYLPNVSAENIGPTSWRVDNLNHVECVSLDLPSRGDLVSGHFVDAFSGDFRPPKNTRYDLEVREGNSTRSIWGPRQDQEGVVFSSYSTTDTNFAFEASIGGTHDFCVRLPYSVPGTIEFHIEVKHLDENRLWKRWETRTTVISRDHDGLSTDETGTVWTCTALTNNIYREDDKRRHKPDCSHCYMENQHVTDSLRYSGIMFDIGPSAFEDFIMHPVELDRHRRWPVHTFPVVRNCMQNLPPRQMNRVYESSWRNILYTLYGAMEDTDRFLNSTCQRVAGWLF